MVGGLIANTSDQDFFFFDAVDGQTFALAFAGLAETNPGVTVYDPQGVVLSTNRSGTGAQQTISETGRHYFSLSPTNSLGSAVGEYAFTIDLLDNAPLFTERGDTFADADDLVTGFSGSFVSTLDSTSDRDLFRFEIDDIEFLRFNLRFSNEEAIVESGKDLRIYNELGQQIVYSPNGTISTEVDDALVPGTYYLEVLANSPIGPGTYALDYSTITNFSLQRDRAVHFMDFDSNDPYLGFNRVAPYAVPAAIDYYTGSFESRYGVYEVDVTRDRPVDGKERVASGIGDFGNIGAGGFGGGGRGLRSSNGNTVNNALETSANSLSKLATALVMHEFGHGVGLPHARDIQALMSYVGTSEYLPVGQTYAFQGTDSRRPQNQVYDVRDYLDFTLQPGAQVYVPESTESAGDVPLDSFLREMSIDFEPDAVYTTQSRPTDVVSGDFNGDGRPDVAVATTAAATNGLEVYLTQTDGTLGAPTFPPIPGTFQWWADPLEVADFNRDSIDDIAFINATTREIGVLISNQDGTFTAATPAGLQGSANSLAVSDFNADGNLDVVVTLPATDQLQVHLGNGDGTFVGDLLTVDVGERPHGVATGDFDGDGNQDVVSANLDSDDMTIWFGDGLGDFSRRFIVAAGDGPDSVVSGDFNDDGIDDAAVVYRGDREVEIFYGSIRRQLIPALSFDTRTSTSYIAIDDIDVDGVEDLIIGGRGDTLKYMLGSSDGTFTRPISVQTGNGEALGVAADFDGDGVSEMAVTNYFGDTLTIVDTPAEDTLNDRVVVFGAIDDDGDVDEYTIDVAADQRMTFDIESAEFQNPLDAIITVFSSSGSVLGSNDDGIDGKHRNRQRRPLPRHDVQRERHRHDPRRGQERFGGGTTASRSRPAARLRPSVRPSSQCSPTTRRPTTPPARSLSSWTAWSTRPP